MAVIVSSNFYYKYTNQNQSYFHTHNNNQTKFHLSSRNSNFSSLYHHHHHHQNRRLCACQSSSNSNNYEAEEQRWLREEKRWLREEQRWLREEARWNNERQSLLRQISELSLQIQHLQSQLDNFRKIRSDSVDYDVDFVAEKTAALLQAKYFNQISDNKSVSELETTTSFGSSLDEEVQEEDGDSSAESEKKEEKKQTTGNAYSILRVGAEGEEVRALQEALMNLGFYSGEEDMEYSSFSSGTDRAVKTWQASIGIREDGIMTIELLERLFASQQTKSSSPPTPSVKDDVVKDKTNGAPISSVRDVPQTVEKKEPADVGIPEHRVFLLGENRWEEPSRMNKGNDKLNTGVKAQSSAPKCLVCRGEGRLLCMECDGTGDPNIEEQFVDWMEEGAKCPYCEGLGYTICDVCDGKSVA